MKELDFLKEVTNYTDEKKWIKNCKTHIPRKRLQRNYSKNIIDKLRHSIAHQSIRPTQEDNDWKGIIFRSYPNDSIAVEWKIITPYTLSDTIWT